MTTVAPVGRWRLMGFDTFSSEWYDLDGEYASAEAAEGAARSRLAELERSQPSVRSGGQGGIQDQVWIVRPSGERYRWT